MRSWRISFAMLMMLVGTTGSAQTSDYRSYVQQLVDAVSRDSLMSFIVTLETFGTRYEYTPQRDSAASYIAREFTRWGLEAESDQYLFGTIAFTGIDLIGDSGVCLVGDKTIIRSTDGGLNWTSSVYQSPGGYTGIDVVDSMNGWVVSSNGLILVTRDGGFTWATQADLSTEYPSLRAVAFADTLRGIAVGLKRSYRTTNGGRLWIPCGSAANNLFDVQMVDSLHAWAVGSNVLATTDGGSTWTRQFVGSSSQLRAVHMLSPTHGWVIGQSWGAGLRAFMLKTIDGGTTWIPQVTPPGLIRLLDVEFRNPLRGWMIDMNGSILRTDDGGQTWHNLQTGWTFKAGKLALRDSAVAYVCGPGPVDEGGLIQKTTDAGETWITLTEHLPSEFIHRSRNIVATIAGKTNPERECIVLAHYDSDSGTPGANDDASGTSAVMEAARVCSKYEFANTIHFLAVSAEELRMLGSGHYVQEAKRQNRDIVVALNADMIGYPIQGDTSGLVISSAWVRIPLLDSAVVFNRRYNIGLRIRDTTDDSEACDYIPFAYAGYPALNVTEGTAWEIWGGADPYYHNPTDTHDKLHPGLIRRGAQLMLATIAELAQPIGRITTVTAGTEVPRGFSLDQNYPNPFNPSTTIKYALPSRSHVTLTVYNTLGQSVRELVNGEMEAGCHSVSFDASGLASGVYFYRIRAGDFVSTKRLLLLR
jgi:photosystem II stability/assembly factor-like uncharacterized protein